MIPIEVVEKFERYETVKLQIRDLEKELKEITPDIIAHVPEGGMTTHVGTFSVSSRAKWLYSSDLRIKEKQLKEDQKYEQKTGIATQEAGTPFITFRANGDKDDDS